jgi:hypothetical protein
LLPAGAVAGWDLHPLESAALSRRTPPADIAMCQQMSGTDINTAAAISAYDQTNIDGGSISHPEWPRDFSSVGLQGLQSSIPGLISRSQPIFIW